MTQRPDPPRPTVAMLRDVGLFGGLSDDVLSALATELPVSIVDPGKDVIAEGDKNGLWTTVIASAVLIGQWR